uniref:C-type lectin domain-containing protein n=1 Tax=Parastrongyloides trichosuri TaxID=131310 RepID=A0A0N4ZDQ3_PARTI
MKLICLTTILVSVLQTITSSCPGEWIYSPHDSKCYKIIKSSSGWNFGEFSCAYEGAHLPSIHSYEQNKFVQELGRRIGSYIWIGAAQYRSNPNYVYADSSSYNYENWSDGRRPSFRKARRCIKMNTSTGYWEQSCCKKKSISICVKDPKLYPGWASSSDSTTTPKVETTTYFRKLEVNNNDNFAAVEGFKKISDISMDLSHHDIFDFKMRDEEPINEGSDGFSKVIKSTDTMANVDATNPILLNPENRERVVLTSIRNDSPAIFEKKDRLDKIQRSPL